MVSPGANITTYIWHFNNFSLVFVIKIIFWNKNFKKIYDEKQMFMQPFC